LQPLFYGDFQQASFYPAKALQALCHLIWAICLHGLVKIDILLTE
jgi:hypothetical protein